MIVVCVGMSEYKMDRLLIILDELCEEGMLKGEEIIAQIGITDYKPKHYRSFELIDREEFQKYIDNAEFIISHAGTGSVIPSIKNGKKVIIFPRLYEYGEHCDNHQLELSNLLESTNMALVATNKDSLCEAIQKIDMFSPAKFVSNNEKINNTIIEFINKQ